MAGLTADELGARGFAALQRGDAPGARAAFQAIVDADAADGAAHLGLALAARMQGEDAVVLAALDDALRFEPDNVRALLMKADILAERGDVRAAVAHYARILALVPDVAGLPSEAAREIARAHRAHGELNQQIFSRLEAHLQREGYQAGDGPPRFREALDILSGRKARFEQEPRQFFYPQLPTIGFYPRADFPWLDRIEAATDAIEGELQALLADPAAFAPYVEAEENRPNDSRSRLLNNPEWTACYLWNRGGPIAANAARCPVTLQALAQAPLERVTGRAPFILFSKLTPGAWIEPHTGFLNTRLVVHLPVIAPEGCWLRVGAERRAWRRGEAWVFNDTITHEARNTGRETRVVLIFNIWRPELSTAERELIASLLAGIDTL